MIDLTTQKPHQNPGGTVAKQIELKQLVCRNKTTEELGKEPKKSKIELTRPHRGENRANNIEASWQRKVSNNS